MSKKHTRKPAPVYPPSWFQINMEPHPLIEEAVRRMVAAQQARTR